MTPHDYSSSSLLLAFYKPRSLSSVHFWEQKEAGVKVHNLLRWKRTKNAVFLLPSSLMPISFKKRRKYSLHLKRTVCCVFWGDFVSNMGGSACFISRRRFCPVSVRMPSREEGEEGSKCPSTTPMKLPLSRGSHLVKNRRHSVCPLLIRRRNAIVAAREYACRNSRCRASTHTSTYVRRTSSSVIRQRR